MNRRQFLRSVAVSAAVLVAPKEVYGLLHSPERPELVAWNMLEDVKVVWMQFANTTMDPKTIEVHLLTGPDQAVGELIMSFSMGPGGLFAWWLEQPLLIKKGWLLFTGSGGDRISLDGIDWAFNTTEHSYTKKGVVPLRAPQ